MIQQRCVKPRRIARHPSSPLTSFVRFCTPPTNISRQLPSSLLNNMQNTSSQSQSEPYSVYGSATRRPDTYNILAMGWTPNNTVDKIEWPLEAGNTLTVREFWSGQPDLDPNSKAHRIVYATLNGETTALAGFRRNPDGSTTQDPRGTIYVRCPEIVIPTRDGQRFGANNTQISIKPDGTAETKRV